MPVPGMRAVVLAYRRVATTIVPQSTTTIVLMPQTLMPVPGMRAVVLVYRSVNTTIILCIVELQLL